MRIFPKDFLKRKLYKVSFVYKTDYVDGLDYDDQNRQWFITSSIFDAFDQPLDNLFKKINVDWKDTTLHTYEKIDINTEHLDKFIDKLDKN